MLSVDKKYCSTHLESEMKIKHGIVPVEQDAPEDPIDQSIH